MPWRQSHPSDTAVPSLSSSFTPLIPPSAQKNKKSTGHVAAPLAKYCRNTGALDNELILGLKTRRNLNIP